ncbi:MAG: AMP-binding protein [Hyphomicrobiaceae bacterium]
MNLSMILQSVARCYPDRAAITWREGSLAYAELETSVAGIAAALRTRHALQPGDRVGLAMTNCPEFFPMLYGIWRAGLVAVPINSKLHARELAWILSNSGARLVVMTPDIAGKAGAYVDEDWPTSIVTDSPDYVALLRGDGIASVQSEPSDNAWIFYTSGTTGRPKGAQLSHRNLLFMAFTYYADIDLIGPTDTMVHAAPLSHGAGLYSLAHISKGSNNVIYPGFDTGEIIASFGRYENVSMFAAPTMVKRLLDDPRSGSSDISGLKTISYGGAPMYVADLKRGLEVFGPRLYQLFGQGEAPMTITGLSKTLHADVDHPRYEARLGSTGVARTGCAFKVVDPAGVDVPIGETGEIITKSDAVMKGYWENPEADATALRDGWLWTGDMGSVDADGFLTIKDRSKDMIISGGSNIYPREIEEVLLTNDAVAECAIVGRPHDDWGEEVIAFVVRRAGHSLEAQDLDQLCLDTIARFKRPKAYRFVDALPKNNYGKILKTELRSWLESAEQ